MTEDLLITAGKWLSGDVVRARTKPLLAVALLASAGAFGYAARATYRAAEPLIDAGPLPSLPPDHDDVRFGLTLEQRKGIFGELAAAEPSSRELGKSAFPGPKLEWSAEDHRGSYERQKAMALALRYQVSLTQVYLTLDEGIRERWPGPDGEPLAPSTVPLNPRRNYGF